MNNETINKTATKMSSKKISIPSIVFLVIIVAVGIMQFQGFHDYFYKAGTGKAFGEMVRSENLHWGSMADAEKAPYQKRAVAAGQRSAVFMALGQYIPAYLFMLIMVGLLTPSISRGLRVFLRIAYWTVWIFGIFFLAVGSGYWGQALPLPQAILPSAIIYIAVAAMCGIILVIGKGVQRSMGIHVQKRKAGEENGLEVVSKKESGTPKPFTKEELPAAPNKDIVKLWEMLEKVFLIKEIEVKNYKRIIAWDGLGMVGLFIWGSLYEHSQDGYFDTGGFTFLVTGYSIYFAIRFVIWALKTLKAK